MRIELILVRIPFLISQLTVFHEADPNVCGPENCALPDCFCAGRTAPLAVDTGNIPQMVILTFDDGVDKDNYKLYRKLFDSDRTNPNGCPIGATFYVSHKSTDYKFVDQLARHGHEIGSHSSTHRMPKSWWRTASYRDIVREMGEQRNNIADQTSLLYSQVKGVRMPFLELGSDKMFAALKDIGFTYDSSCMSGRLSAADWRSPSWPYTLDYGPSLEFCDSLLRPFGNFSGLWEVPLNRLLGLDGQSCSMADSCQSQTLSSSNDVLKYLAKNFESYYRSSRAPFGVYLHSPWLEKDHHLDGFDKFIRMLLQMDDVYIITVSQVRIKCGSDKHYNMYKPNEFSFNK